MRQLALELNGYPRPIAWTLSEVDRAVGDRDRRDMLLTAFEEVTRYLVLVQLARYTEYWAKGRGDEAVERRIADLRRPSFGHYVAALAVLDQFLAETDDPYSINASERRRGQGILQLYRETGSPGAKAVPLIGLLGRVVELRNRDKGHGYTAQYDAKQVTESLQPALTELVGYMPILLARPLVWIELIEYLDENRWTVTLLELMGTQRARRLTREVQSPGQLKKGFIYMWDGESAPLQLTPFLHLEQVGHDERVYVLAGLAGEPIYQARGTPGKCRTPDKLLSQFSERAPFLLESPRSVTTARQPDASRWYRSAVDLALADGVVTEAEAKRLAAMRLELGIAEGEAEVIHAELGWVPEDKVKLPPAPSERQEQGSSAATPRKDGTPTGSAWPDRAHAFLASVREHTESLDDVAELVVLDDQVDVRKGELWFQLGRTQGVAVWFSSRRGTRVSMAVGFYSLNASRDPAYRTARRHLEAEGGPALPSGWTAFTRKSRAHGLAYETRKRVEDAEVAMEGLAEEVARVVSSLVAAAVSLLTGREKTVAPAERLEDSDAPVSIAVADDFELTPLEGDPRIQGSIWKARILWALEWARRHDPAPKSAADIARILSANGVPVPPTNTARAFRKNRDDPRCTGLCEEPASQRYVISNKGRRALFELMVAAELEGAQ